MKNILITSLLLWMLNLTFFASLLGVYDSWYHVAFESIAYLIVILFLVTLTAFMRSLYIFFINFYFIVSIFAVYFIATMGIELDGQMLNNILSTDTAETFELLNASFVLYLLSASLALVLLNKKLIWSYKRVPTKRYFAAIVLLLVIALGFFKIDRDFIDRFSASDTPKVAPLFLIPSLSEYVILRERLQKIEKKNISNEFILEDKYEPLLIVFVLGESARGDRFSINGYTKETSKELQNVKNLISFKGATSCHTSTLNSIPCLMTRVLERDYEITITESSFVEILKDLGFDTYWFSKHSVQKRVDTFCKEAQVCKYFSKTPFDMELLEPIVELQTLQKPTLVVLHMLGSHLDYNARVPQEFQKFSPLCLGNVSGCSQESLNNSYDNTILYTDHFLATLIKELQDKNAMLLYTSDHGESLGEGSVMARYGHATPPSIAPLEQRNVPFMLWFSDKFIASHKDLNISKIATTTGVSHDNVFETILGAAGVAQKNKKKFEHDLLHH